MRRCTRFSRHCVPLLILLLLFLLFAGGCSDSSGEKKEEKKPSGPLRDVTPQVLAPQAPGTVVGGTDTIRIDSSCVSDGYVVLVYTGTNEKVKLQLKMPDGVTCTYLVTARGEPLVYPLSGGNGTYSVSVLESVSIEEDLYAIAYTEDIPVTLSSEFAPFLTPNCYVAFTEASACVEKGKELAGNCYSDLDVVTNIYNYVIKNISYDHEKAENVSYGYTPDPDATLEAGNGICFDYASLMSAMLRSQRIPSKLEVGYSGDVYHAWISCYVDEIGWVDNIIQFDGEHWSLMDPTLAASNDSSAVKEYVGDGSNYTVKYTY